MEISHPFDMASPNPSQFDLLVMSPNLELQEGNYLGINEEPSSLDSFPSLTLGLVTREPGESSHQAEIMSMQPTQPATSLHQRDLLDGGNTSGEQAWKIGGNHSNQSWPIPWPQTPFPHSAMGLGVGHGENDFDQTSPIPWPQTPFPHNAMRLGVGHGENDFDQTSPIPWPQTPFPHNAMGHGVRYGAPHSTHQQEENWVPSNQTNPYEASSGEVPSIPNVVNAQYSEALIRFHQFIDESPMIPIALDAQYSSSVTPQQAMPIWGHGMSQQQTNDQVLMDASNASIDAAVDISMLLPETSIPYGQSLYPGQHVQPNQRPILDANPLSYDSRMNKTSMMIGPPYSASYQQANQAPFVQSFVNEADAGIMFSPPASSIPQSSLGFSNDAPPVIPNLNPGQSQFMNPEMMDGITQEQSQSWLNLGPSNSSSQPQGYGRIINSVYDPMYETLGLPIDPHLRMFLARQGGNASSSGQNATWQSNSEPQPRRLLDK